MISNSKKEQKVSEECESLFHYTNALEAILRSCNLWAMRYDCFDDKSEFKVFPKVIRILALKAGIQGSLILDKLEQTMCSFIYNSLEYSYPYVTCLTPARDNIEHQYGRLDQFRLYGQCAIEFNTIYLEKLMYAEKILAELSSVEYFNGKLYRNDKLECTLEKLTSELLVLYRDILQRKSCNQDKVKSIMMKILSYAARIKDYKFDTESEVRAIVRPNGHEIFRTPEGKVYIELFKGQETLFKKSITGIILGPNCTHTIQEVASMLERYGYASVKIRQYKDLTDNKAAKYDVAEKALL